MALMTRAGCDFGWEEGTEVEDEEGEDEEEEEDGGEEEGRGPPVDTSQHFGKIRGKTTTTFAWLNKKSQISETQTKQRRSAVRAKGALELLHMSHDRGRNVRRASGDLL